MNELQYFVWRKLKGDKMDAAQIQQLKKCNYTVATTYAHAIDEELTALARVYAKYPEITSKLKQM